jgi:hypothetical protein
MDNQVLTEDQIERLATVGGCKMKDYRVTLFEDLGDEFLIVFDCMADDFDHAADQATNAYPHCDIFNITEFEG